MRFLHLNHRYHPFVGGSEMYMREISEWLAGTGHAVTLVTSMAADLEAFWDATRREVNAPESEIVDGVLVRRVPIGRFPGQAALTPPARRAMGELSRLDFSGRALYKLSSLFPWLPQLEVSLVNCGPPDCVLVTNLGLEGMALSGASVAREYAVPLVLIPFTHIGAQGDRTARRYVSMPHQTGLLRAADLVLALTDIEATFLEALGVKPARIRTLHCGVREELVTGGCGRRIRERLGARGTLVGALGALAPEKGTPHLVEAVANLRRIGVEIDLALAGPSMTSFERWWSRLPEASREGIHLLGTIDDVEKRDLLDAIDLLALPSRTESFGIVYLEAWLNLKPVIAARAGAVPEVVEDEVSGLLVEYGDVAAIGTAISRLAGDRALRERLGSAGYERTRRQYTWEAVYKRFKAAYRDVLGIDLGGA